MSRSSIAIQLTNVSKKYIIHHEKPTLVEALLRPRKETFWALQNITITIRPGEKIGIIGPNGSGKTTLLKIIAGITTPTDGTVHSHGRVVSLIDLEAGFHPDLTGVQNILLNGMLLGMNRHEIAALTPDIIRFADIHGFIDAPLFTYSQGMKLRLGFSIAIHSNPDILLLDENIGVGDENFQKKSTDRLMQFHKSGRTILMASHWMHFFQRECSRLLHMQNGNIIKITRPKHIPVPRL